LTAPEVGIRVRFPGACERREALVVTTAAREDRLFLRPRAVATFLTDRVLSGLGFALLGLWLAWW
jgi:hypothetical protein